MIRRRKRFTVGEQAILHEPVDMRDESLDDNYHRVSVYHDKELLDLVNNIHTMTVNNEFFSHEYIRGLKEEKKITESRKYVKNFAELQVEEIAKDPEKRVPLTQEDRESVIEAVINEIVGYGPLEPLLEDETVTDILVNTYKHVYVERRGKLEPVPIQFKDNEHLLNIIRRIVEDTYRHIDRVSPMVDARLDRETDRAADGVQRVRVNAIIEPLAIDGPTLSIRKFPEEHMTLQRLIDNGTLTEDMANVLVGVCQAKLNVLISGGTGSGKTTLLNALSEYISPRERIITIEDTAELHLLQEHVVRLETRPPDPNSQEANKGEITQRDLLKNSLRMRPDRIIVGEVRGNEALDMLQAMNTGHDGSLTTIHANSGRDALIRLETMVAMASANTSSYFIRQSISRAFHVVIQMARLGDARKIIGIQEVTGMNDDVINMQDIFIFRQTGVDGDKVRGEFRPGGMPPKFIERFEAKGIQLSDMERFGSVGVGASFYDMFDSNNIVHV